MPKTDNRPSTSFTHQQPTTPLATLHQQPFDRPKPDNSKFDPSTSPVQVQQSPETHMDNDSDSDNHSVTQKLSTGHYEEGEVSDQEQDTSVTDRDQASTKEQNYRETMRGVPSCMGWTHIPDIDNQELSAQNNPFAEPKQQPGGKVSVNLPTDDWLCKKLDGLNLTLTQDICPEALRQGVCKGTSL